jgi:hypothetical protein
MTGVVGGKTATVRMTGVGGKWNGEVLRDVEAGHISGAKYADAK